MATHSRELSIIIVNWNTRELLSACLRSLIESSISDWPASEKEIIVVDNASSDGSAEMVRAEFADVTLIASAENLGYAGGNNVALEHATGKYILLLNPDTIVMSDAISYLYRVLGAMPDAGIAGAQLLNADDSLQMSWGTFPSLWSELPLINRLFGRRSTRLLVQGISERWATHRVDSVSGACLMIKREVIDRIGFLDESFWLYTEETDWCYRAHRAGWTVLSVPQSRVYHLARAASRQRYCVTMQHFYQSRVRFIRKHRGGFQAGCVQQIFRAKARIWQWKPARSPLRSAYPYLNHHDIASAYEELSHALALPLDTYLTASW